MYTSNILQSTLQNSSRIGVFGTSLGQTGNSGQEAVNNDPRNVSSQTAASHSNISVGKLASGSSSFLEVFQNQQPLTDYIPAKVSQSTGKSALTEGINPYLAQIKEKGEVLPAQETEKEGEDLRDAMQAQAQGNQQLRTYRQAIARYQNQQLT